MSDTTVHFPLNTIQPGAYGVIDASALQDAETNTGAAVPAVLGDCKGGVPNAIAYFTSMQALKSALRSGPAVDVARAAFIGGARRVGVVRVGNGIAQSTAALAGSAGTCITLTSIDYGTWTNSIKVTVAANNKVTITYTDANGTTFTEVFNAGAGATAQDVADLINGVKPNVAASAWVTAAAGVGTMPLAAAAIAALASGADTGAIVTGDWTAGLAVLETEPVDFVVAATGDAAVHAQVLTHCNAMSTATARHERTTIVGGPLAENVAAQVTRMSSLRDKRAQLVYPGISLFDGAGVLTLYAPFVAAGYTAGKHCALPDAATSLLHADVDVVNVEKRLSTIAGGDVDQLLAAGVTPIAPKPGGGFWYSDSLSGYAADASFRDFHKGRTADVSLRRLRERLEGKFVGGKALTGTADSIKREAIAELLDQVTEELLRAAGTPTVKQSPTDPRTHLVTAPVMLPDTNKFILLTLALQPASTLAAGTTS